MFVVTGFGFWDSGKTSSGGVYEILDHFFHEKNETKGKFPESGCRTCRTVNFNRQVSIKGVQIQVVFKLERLILIFEKKETDGGLDLWYWSQI
jgi:hypothetical protein